MLKGIVVGVVILIVGLFLVSRVILPGASVLLDRPDIDTWTGLGAGLHLLGLLLVGFLVFVSVKAMWPKRGSDE